MSDPLTLIAQRRPDKLAVVDDRPDDGVLVEWSFAELESEANRLAHVLAAHGARPGTKISWCGLNSPGVIRVVHAARKLGATAVPLNYRLSAEEAAYVVDNCDAELAYIDADFIDLFAALRGDAPRLRDILVYGDAGDGRVADAGMISADAELATPGKTRRP
jgi:acyl-CoA synthetase (AMP-forming)/AMP-acid ligase II